MGGGKYCSPAAFAHLEALTASELYPAFTAALAQDFAHLCDVHNGRAVDAVELARIERVCQLLDGFTQHGTDMQASVIVGGFDPFDFIHVDEGIPGAVGHDEAAGIISLCTRNF